MPVPSSVTYCTRQAHLWSAQWLSSCEAGGVGTFGCHDPVPHCQCQFRRFLSFSTRSASPVESTRQARIRPKPLGLSQPPILRQPSQNQRHLIIARDKYTCFSHANTTRNAFSGISSLFSLFQDGCKDHDEHVALILSPLVPEADMDINFFNISIINRVVQKLGCTPTVARTEAPAL